ncbi:glutaminase [Aliihoeflea sp. 40Bstr573]|uniref:glutaminase n=1 Tax=Aliihoeflea sp. 40Bstr573 TaxID=2696467 RepID=UPI00209410B1|nr:glutaminase [Aliihoeflea sp. 40Bstr573]MCO6388938.1 glutaminase [Aliihoeflea sp. 40Bstr573]
MAGRDRTDIDHDLLKKVVDGIAIEIANATEWGKAADYIPELAKVDTKQFGIAVLTRDEQMISGGASETQFSIQSISKVFALTLALKKHGDKVWTRVGKEPSGDPYNSIVDMERHKGIPRNPFINAGALVVDDMLLDERTGDDIPDTVRDFIAEMIGDGGIGIDEDVVASEQTSGYTNKALANLAKSFGNLHHEVADVMHIYVRQCAVALSCQQLARAGRYLMLDREDIDDKVSKDDAERARRVNAIMLTCGQYDGSGDFAYRVGLPAKSGVGGGILAIVPNTASIAVWSPGLDDNGNSLLGTLALERLSKRMDWSIFGAIRRV